MIQKSVLINSKFLTLLVALLFSTSILFSKEYPKPGKNNSIEKSRAANCDPGSAQADLQINNVRFRVLTGGDLWWDASSNPHYEVPAGSGKHSIFAGALWIGGIDAMGQLKVAAQTYRQTGDDFWPGPINMNTGDITTDRCNYYDRVWKISKAEVEKFSRSKKLTDNITNWPGSGDPAYNEDHYLAPFFDKDGDGLYNPSKGDYPRYPIGVELSSSNCQDYLHGDEILWWVFNDKGNLHTQTNGEQLGIEVRAQAYGFDRRDAVGNMTFYNYQMINRSNIQINEMWFGQWVDTDLGNAVDDYIGCDVLRGVGYTYNGDEDDDGPGGYGINPPSVGVDFLNGPLADANDGIDNDRDGIIDEIGERIQMSSYLDYDFFWPGNPDGADEFYNYLRGLRSHGQPITFGGGGTDPNAPPTTFMFSGTTNPDFVGQNWTEISSGITPGDRNFLLGAGPFTFPPGAVQTIDIGVIWAKTNQGGRLESLNKMLSADDYAQALFDNCFQSFEGPKAPEVAIRELENEIIITLVNTNNSDVELFRKIDPYISEIEHPNDEDRKYKFQGYQIFQLRNEHASINDIGDPDKIRLIAQCDIMDDISQIINYRYDDNLKNYVATEMVHGENEGIKHAFQIKHDAFLPANSSLVNHNTYYYTAIAYAYNNIKNMDVSLPPDINFTQHSPYLRSTNNIKIYSAIPHSPFPEAGGMLLGSVYGNQPVLTRIEGQGNGGLNLKLKQSSIDEIMQSPFHKSLNPVYVLNHGPVGVKIYDPISVQSANYEIKLLGVDSADKWKVTNLNNQSVVNANHDLAQPYQQAIPAWGLMTEIFKVAGVGSAAANGNGGGLISIISKYGNSNKAWLDFVLDVDEANHEDWILAGAKPIDKTIDEVWENTSGWAPYKIASKDTFGPQWRGAVQQLMQLSFLNSIDLVITNDNSKWTRAPVVEMGYVSSFNVGNAEKASLRVEQSVDKNGNFAATGSGASLNDNDANFISETGMGWFPGYAINVETGERLNIAFGENSSFTNQNSRDMIWNPTSDKFETGGNPIFGGGHYIYVFDRNGYRDDKDVPHYDYGKWLVKHIDSTYSSRRYAWKDCIWTCMPLLKSGSALLATDYNVSLRVVKDYEPYPSRNEILDSTQNISIGTQYFVYNNSIMHDGINYNMGESFTATTNNFTGQGVVVTPLPANNFNPMYSFNTKNLIAETGNIEIAKTALDLINVVPNPYFGFTGYEHISLDTRVKFTNLPSKCTISIFNMNGSLVKKIKRNLTNNNQTAGGSLNGNMDTSESWDLKNESGKLVGSGMYIVHIDAYDLGEKTLKLALFNRDTDLLNEF